VNPSGRYAINSPHVVAEDFDGEMVILNLGNGHYYSLRGIASPIWSALLAGHAPDSILASVRAMRPELVAASSALIDRLVELGLVQPRAAGAEGATESIAASWSGDAPAIEVFEDLADLIHGDPIHDVDEQTGWPTPRPTR
jgi:hypothetical protein